MNYFETIFHNLVKQTVLSELTAGNVIMILIALFLLYLSAAKGYEIFLLLPAAFGILTVNLVPELMKQPGTDGSGAGVFYYFSALNKWGIFLPIIFFGIGMLIDFGPLIARPVNLIFGVAAQSGIFVAYLMASGLGLEGKDAASAAMAGSADGPVSAFVIGRGGQADLLGPIAVIAYFYMALGPIIVPRMMSLFTTKKEKQVQMSPLRTASKTEKILFSIGTAILISFVLPSVASVIGMLMLGNLLKESGALKFLTDSAARALLYISLTFLGIAAGAAASANNFLQEVTWKVLLIGLAGMLASMVILIICAKAACLLTGGKINPLACAAAGAALPSTAEVSQKIYQKDSQNSSILPFAMGANAAGLLATVMAAGVMLGILGK